MHVEPHDSIQELQRLRRLKSHRANTDMMNARLAMISRQVGPRHHVILVLDQAGWHVAEALQVPDNITLPHLPPYSPELNPIERRWACLRSHYLSNRVFVDDDHLWQACAQAWNPLHGPGYDPSATPIGRNAVTKRKAHQTKMSPSVVVATTWH